MKYAFSRIFKEELSDIIRLSLMASVFCIPIVTIVPTVIAVKGTVISLLDDRCLPSRVGNFRMLFKKKFLKGLLLELLAVAYGFMILWCLSLAEQLEGPGAQLVETVTVFMGFAAILVFDSATSIIAGTDSGLGDALWNGLCFSFGRLPQAGAAAISVMIILILCYLTYPISLVPLVAILLGLMFAMDVAFIWEPYSTLILDHSPQDAPEE